MYLAVKHQDERQWKNDAVEESDVIMNRLIPNCLAPKKVVKAVQVGSSCALGFESELKIILEGLEAEELHKIESMAYAYAQCLTGQIVLEFPINFVQSLVCLLSILRIGHQIIRANCDWEDVRDQFLLAELSRDYLSTPVAVFKFVAACFGSVGGLAELVINRCFPDAGKTLEKNALLQISQVKFFVSKLPTTAFSLSSTSSVSLHSMLPVAYTNQRDSKNLMVDPVQYSNQQRVRDLFLNLIRHYSTLDLSLAVKSVGFRRGFSGRVMELMSKLSRDNCCWLADLFMQEYEQTADLRVDRLLEERRKSLSLLGDSTLDQLLFMFLRESDSHRLIRAVELKCKILTENLVQQSNSKRQQLWAENMRRLRSLVKLLVFCRYQLNYEEPVMEQEAEEADSQLNEDLLVLKWVQEAIAEKTVLTLLPVLFDLFKSMGPAVVKRCCSASVRLLVRYQLVKFVNRTQKIQQRNQLFIKLALEDLFKEVLDGNWISVLVLEEQVALADVASTTFATHNAAYIDEDDSIPIVAVYRLISGQLRQLYHAFNSVAPVEESDALNLANNSVPPSPTFTNKRVVRPIVQVPAADLQKSRMQRQLRHWFWWRYAAQKELIDCLTQYIIDHLLLIRRPTDVDAVKQQFRELFDGVVRPLLPKPLFEHQEMVNLILGLSYEHAFKLIDQRHGAGA